MRTLAAGWTCLVLGLAGPLSIDAQTVPDAEAPPAAPQVQWSFVDSDFADLWFGGLARIGFVGSGDVSLYDGAYAARVQEDKQAAGVAPTRLDRDADRFRDMFSADPAFEVLHFVPVYFAGLGRDEILDALDGIATEPAGIPDAPSMAARFGTTAVATVLTGREQRQILGGFVAALRDEWTRYLAAARARESAERSAAVSGLAARWNEAYAPYLSDYLTGWHLDFGLVLVSPALGPEGRFFQGDPENSADNIVAVAIGAWDGSPDRVLAGVVRELCFPPVRHAFTEADVTFADRSAASRASDRAATRCGELLLEGHAPHLLSEYRAAFQGQLNSPSQTTDDPAMDPTVERILKGSLKSN